MGREISPSTQKWWAAQPKAAREHWADVSDSHRADGAGVWAVVRTFCKGRKKVWANGAAFDLSNLDCYFRQLGEVEPPWLYRAARDMRTVCDNPSNGRALTLEAERALLPADFEWIEHHPITDCVRQIARVWEHVPIEPPLAHHPV